MRIYQNKDGTVQMRLQQDAGGRQWNIYRRCRTAKGAPWRKWYSLENSPWHDTQKDAWEALKRLIERRRGTWCRVEEETGDWPEWKDTLQEWAGQ